MVALSYTRPRTPMAAAPRPSTMLARPMSWVTTMSFGKRRSTMAKSALSAPIETSSTSTQKPSWLASRPRAFSRERGSPWRMCRSRFCVVLPTMTTGVQASRAQARATLVTGQASASINRTRPRGGAVFFTTTKFRISRLISFGFHRFAKVPHPFFANCPIFPSSRLPRTFCSARRTQPADHDA